MTPGDYALLHANGATWAELLDLHTEEIAEEQRRVLQALADERDEADCSGSRMWGG